MRDERNDEPRRPASPWTGWLLTGLLLGAASNVFALDPAAVERGRYLVKIGGCNDCHTRGYLAAPGAIPESEWLTGDRFGWRGPWGTSYATNLRLLIAELDEPTWVSMAKHLKARPLMPWSTVNAMSDEDLRAIYRFIRHLGPKGQQAPAPLPPGVEPPWPYVDFPVSPAQ